MKPLGCMYSFRVRFHCFRSLSFDCKECYFKWCKSSSFVQILELELEIINANCKPTKAHRRMAPFSSAASYREGGYHLFT